MDNDTIAAIATPLGSGGIGIVRISGPQAISIVRRIFSARVNDDSDHPPKAPGGLVSHHLSLGYISDPSSKEIIDEVLMVAMMAPKSYTREDVVEIQSHGGYVVLGRILKSVLDAGARMAEPGEFTKRAFLSGRIDLSQAEAIAEMISAKTETGQQIAAAHLKGDLKDTVLGLLDLLTEIQVELEAGIEFPEDVEPTIDRERIAGIIQTSIKEPVETLIRHYDTGHVYRDGIRLDIVGRPNVGKSSLLNRLINKDKAIVTSIPGTTRDLVEDYATITGIPVLITDTAGLHSTEDPIEIIGIKKTRENLERSDLVLWVVDGEQGITHDDLSISKHITDRNTLLVINKLDLIADPSEFALPDNCRHLPHIFISAKFGEGIDRLKEAIRDKCLSDVQLDPGRTMVPNLRQKEALDSTLEFLKQVLYGIDNQGPDELIAADILGAKNSLGLITGDYISEDILDEIFGKFCIGK